MSGELLYLIVSAVFLVLLWLFVLAVMWAIRSDLFGPKVKRMHRSAAVASPAPQSTGRRAARSDATAARHLVFLEGPARGRQLTLAQDMITLGRSADCTVVLRDDYTSSQHARLTRRGATWVVEDLGSTNGTTVAGRRISRPTPVAVGVPITIGTTVMELRG
jgi:hypothetical protein